MDISQIRFCWAMIGTPVLKFFNQRSRVYGSENTQAPSSSSNICQQPLATLLYTCLVFWTIRKQVAYIWHWLESVDVPWATWKSLQSAVSTKTNRAGHIDRTKYFIHHFNKSIESSLVVWWLRLGAFITAAWVLWFVSSCCMLYLPPPKKKERKKAHKICISNKHVPL